MIRDQLFTNYPGLFMLPDNLPLTKAVAFQLESAALLTSWLTAPDPTPSLPASLAQALALAS